MRSVGKTLLVLCGLVAAGMLPSLVSADVRSHALYARGLIPFNNGQWDQAYRLFDAAVGADRSDPEPLYYRGLTQARRGALAAGISDLEQALKLSPSLPHAGLDLGIAYFDAGQYPAAKVWLQRAYEQGDDRFTAAFFLGLTLYRLGEDASALTYLNQANADPDLRPAAHYYAGLAQLHQGNEVAARSELAETAREQPLSEIGKLAQRYAGGGDIRQPPVPLPTARRKPWSLSASLGFQYDTNVVLAPSDSGLKTAQGITGEDDGRFVIGAGGAYTLLDTDYGTVRGAYDFSQSVHFRWTEFDLQGHRLRLDAASKPGVVSYGLSGVYDFYALDYQSFFQELLGTPWVSVAEGDSAATQLYYTARGRDFLRKPFDPARDAIDHAVGVRQYLDLGSPERVLSVGYQFDAEATLAHAPDDQQVSCTSTSQTGGCGARDFDYKAHQLDIGINFPIFSLAQGQAGYLFRLEDYQFLNSRANFQFRRHDQEHQFVVDARREITPHVSATLGFIGILNNSNIPAFDYDRFIISAGVLVTL